MAEMTLLHFCDQSFQMATPLEAYSRFVSSITRFIGVPTTGLNGSPPEVVAPSVEALLFELDCSDRSETGSTLLSSVDMVYVLAGEWVDDR